MCPKHTYNEFDIISLIPTMFKKRFCESCLITSEVISIDYRYRDSAITQYNE